MRVTAIMAGVVSCALIFVVSDAKVNAEVPLQVALSESPSLLSDLSEASEKAAQEEAAAQQAAAEAEAKPAEPEIVTYVVEEGDNLAKIAEAHETTWVRLFNKNVDIEHPDVINAGDELVIPHDDEVLEERELPQPPQPEPEPAAATTAARQPRATTEPVQQPARATVRGSSAGNSYAYGYCTWYVKNRRPDLPNNLGDADTWLSRARAQGYATGSTPRAGAVAYALTGYMHVAYVERVNGDGTVTVSEMNFRGHGITSSRTVPASSFAYIY